MSKTPDNQTGKSANRQRCGRMKYKVYPASISGQDPTLYRYIGSVGNARSIYTCWKKGLKRIVRRLLSCCTPQDKKFKICIARLPVLKKNKADCKDFVRSLDSYFIPKVNVPFERCVFRQMKQQSHEKVYQFVCRPRQRAITCEVLNVDETIRDQRIVKCRDGRLRR